MLHKLSFSLLSKLLFGLLFSDIVLSVKLASISHHECLRWGYATILLLHSDTHVGLLLLLTGHLRGFIPNVLISIADNISWVCKMCLCPSVQRWNPVFEVWSCAGFSHSILHIVALVGGHCHVG